MTRYLHTLSAILFYLLGTSFFVAYILSFNEIAPVPSRIWMDIADLPFIGAALLYGGSSVYLSLTQDRTPSRGLGLTLALPLILIFLLTILLTFWPTTFVLNP